MHRPHSFIGNSTLLRGAAFSPRGAGKLAKAIPLSCGASGQAARVPSHRRGNSMLLRGQPYFGDMLRMRFYTELKAAGPWHMVSSRLVPALALPLMPWGWQVLWAKCGQWWVGDSW